ncbi:hypothetical protein SAMN05421503_3437 [Terribacillus aidingensis]|uniref:Uncharacterized protein n=1 Tax=Terribacillus aidingensis TaxID=586416 RepID=A0A285P8G4_9BACI|nr:hypothetical protein [Terribacillus aidingensis]SNZ18014.1 hypothetical protein SAMN05421503_3437 [Terribacillus aidingensis]
MNDLLFALAFRMEREEPDVMQQKYKRGYLLWRWAAECNKKKGADWAAVIISFYIDAMAFTSFIMAANLFRKI